MRRYTRIKRPEFIEVRGIRYAVIGSLMHWRENKHHELSCDRCDQPLIVAFGARQEQDITREDRRFWIPTALTCSCHLPKVTTLVEMPRRLRRPKQDTRLLEFQC